ncbi:MAG: peptidyl-prolyl cis-trans isomerase [Chlamydiae bacterium]|nr:Peptidyl-prolyl cis-trans isomerase B [Chlamydiales bacterium]MCH9704026.1 peptidyl-prolyl cis-trans isomerase [Chlamydiota bacterium]
MKTIRFLLCLFLVTAFSILTANSTGSQMANPKVTIHTNLGEIEVELFQAKAPDTVSNFLEYAKAGHYNGTIFHRVIDGFMIQGGGFAADFQEKKTRAPIRNEADNRVSNKRGTIAMARTSDIHSATAQFFINVADNNFLDFRNPTVQGFGYCVFGEVTSGMDVVDKIKKAKTGDKKGHSDVPLQSISIVEVTVH